MTRFDEFYAEPTQRGPHNTLIRPWLSVSRGGARRNSNRGNGPTGLWKTASFGFGRTDRVDPASRATHGKRWYYSGIFSAFASSPMMPRRNSSTTTTNTTPWITVTHCPVWAR